MQVDPQEITPNVSLQATSLQPIVPQHSHDTPPLSGFQNVALIIGLVGGIVSLGAGIVKICDPIVNRKRDQKTKRNEIFDRNVEPHRISLINMLTDIDISLRSVGVVVDEKTITQLQAAEQLIKDNFSNFSIEFGHMRTAHQDWQCSKNSDFSEALHETVVDEVFSLLENLTEVAHPSVGNATARVYKNRAVKALEKTDAARDALKKYREECIS